MNIFYKVLKHIALAFSHLPLRVLYVFSDFTYFLMYYVVRYRQKVVRKNLEIAFPHKTEAERRDIEKRFYRHFSDYIFETAKSMTIPIEELMKRMVITNTEEVNKFTDEGRSVFVYAAHFGNWEWFITWPYYFKAEKIQTFYKPQRNQLADDLTLHSRKRFNIVAVPSHHGFRHMVSSVRRGEKSVTLIIGDQAPSRGAKKYWTNLFGRDTDFLLGPTTIASKLNLVLFFPYFKKYRRGYYEVEMRLLEVDPAHHTDAQMIDRFAAMLEDNIRELPELWLWSHRRWKHRHEDFPDEQ